MNAFTPSTLFFDDVPLEPAEHHHDDECQDRHHGGKNQSAQPAGNPNGPGNPDGGTGGNALNAASTLNDATGTEETYTADYPSTIRDGSIRADGSPSAVVIRM